MTSKRAPLANVPNAVNSPFRSVTVGSGKRTRAQAGDTKDNLHEQPPAKKQVIEIPDEDEENVDPRKRSAGPVKADRQLEEPFSKRTTNAQPTAFERKLASVRDKKPTPQEQRTEQPQKATGDNLETVRQWKRHYKRQFPGFVFYFESVSDDVRVKTSRQLQTLGAREEKFFSKAVTHVITTRPIPSELASTSPDEDVKVEHAQARTVQPPALTQDQRKTTSLLDANLQRRAQSQTHIVTPDVDPRKAQAHTADILSRARELGIKIWALEKLQRMLKTLLETETGDSPVANDVRTVTAGKTVTKPAKDADLEQLLRNEKINGPADRDLTVAAQDMVPFKGTYIYIHDMDEKTKPVMVRDYPKPQTKEHGKWPQFRLTPIGRCPFIEDPAHTKKLQQQERETQAAAKAEQELAAQRKTRAGSATAPAARALTDVDANLRRSPRKTLQQPNAGLAKPLDPPKQVPTKRQSSAEGMPLFGSTQQNQRGLPRMIGGEPVASGLQHSNVTSAIRSQVISSAAISSTAIGVNNRVGDSKEISTLKRKVLERGASQPSNHSMPSSYMNDVRAAINDDSNPPPRAAKRKAQETLGVVHEGDEDNQDHPRPTHRRPPAPRKRKPVQKELKPGYCENCRDKYDDFDDVSSVLSSLHLLIEANEHAAYQLSQAPQICSHPRKLERPRCSPGPTQTTAQDHIILPDTHTIDCCLLAHHAPVNISFVTRPDGIIIGVFQARKASCLRITIDFSRYACTHSGWRFVW